MAASRRVAIESLDRAIECAEKAAHCNDVPL